MGQCFSIESICKVCLEGIQVLFSAPLHLSLLQLRKNIIHHKTPLDHCSIILSFPVFSSHCPAPPPPHWPLLASFQYVGCVLLNSTLKEIKMKAIHISNNIPCYEQKE